MQSADWWLIQPSEYWLGKIVSWNSGKRAGFSPALPPGSLSQTTLRHGCSVPIVTPTAWPHVHAFAPQRNLIQYDVDGLVLIRAFCQHSHLQSLFLKHSFTFTIILTDNIRNLDLRRTFGSFLTLREPKAGESRRRKNDEHENERTD